MQEALVGQSHSSVWSLMCECIGTTKYTLFFFLRQSWGEDGGWIQEEKLGRAAGGSPG